MAGERRRGRRPGCPDTKGLIADTAQEVFTGKGYDKTSLRAVARKAEVDPALVHHYFGSKAGLFATSMLGIDQDPTAFATAVTATGNSEIGSRITEELFRAWEDPDVVQRTREMLQSSMETDSSRPLTEFITKELFRALATALGHPDAAERAAMATTAVLSCFLSRHVLVSRPPTAAMNRRLRQELSIQLQHLLVGEE